MLLCFCYDTSSLDSAWVCYTTMETNSSALGQILQTIEDYEKSIVYLDYAMKLSIKLHNEKETTSLTKAMKKTVVVAQCRTRQPTG